MVAQVRSVAAEGQVGAVADGRFGGHTGEAIAERRIGVDHDVFELVNRLGA